MTHWIFDLQGRGECLEVPGFDPHHLSWPARGDQSADRAPGLDGDFTMDAVLPALLENGSVILKGEYRGSRLQVRQNWLAQCS